MGSILRHGSEDQKQKWLPQIADGLRLQVLSSSGLICNCSFSFTKFILLNNLKSIALSTMVALIGSLCIYRPCPLRFGVQAFGVSEPNNGTDTLSLETKAVKVDGGYKINGQKIWTSRALQSDLMILLARTGGSNTKRSRVGLDNSIPLNPQIKSVCYTSSLNGTLRYKC